MTELERVDAILRNCHSDPRWFKYLAPVDEIGDIARKALEENAELKKDFTVSEDLRMVRERQLKHVMDQRDRLQRRLDDAVGIMFDMSLEDKQNG